MKKLKKLMRKCKKCKWKSTIIAMFVFIAALAGHHSLNVQYDYDKLITLHSQVLHMCHYEGDLFLSGDSINLFADFCEACGENMSGAEGFIYCDDYCANCDKVRLDYKYCSKCGSTLEEKERINLNDTPMKNVDGYIKVRIAIIICRLLIYLSSLYLLLVEMPKQIENITKSKKSKS